MSFRECITCSATFDGYSTALRCELCRWRRCEWCQKLHRRLDHKFCSRSCFRQSQMGHDVSTTTREAISRANTGNGGWHHTEKAKRAIGDSNRGRKRVDPGEQKLRGKLYYECVGMLRRILTRNNEKKNKHTAEELGYTKEQLKAHLEVQFKDGMSWKNWGEWHIDHFRGVVNWPVGTPPNVVNALWNLRPLWKRENLSRPRFWPIKPFFIYLPQGRIEVM
jgi:hypothetical protein